MNSLRLPQTASEISDSNNSKASFSLHLALRAGLFNANTTFADFRNCSSLDAQYMAEHGFPLAQPGDESSLVVAADIVSFTAMENNPAQLVTLEAAWRMTSKVLIVSAVVQISNFALWEQQATRCKPSRNYLSQTALKECIEKVLGVDALPAGLGVYFIFRDKTQAHRFTALRFHRREMSYLQAQPLDHLKKDQTYLESLTDFIATHGRLPLQGELELSIEQEIISQFGNLSQAFEVITEGSSHQAWQGIQQKRCEDLLLYLAYSHFARSLEFESITLEIQHDIEASLGTYEEACRAAKHMLLKLKQPGTIAKLCRLSKIGKRLPDALYVHSSALEDLDPLLRIYEAFTTRAIGFTGATLIKFQVNNPKISYLFYPNFDEDPHPPLQASLQINSENLELSYRDYSKSANPPILHRKETFVTPSYPLYRQFSELTQSEERWGLLSNSRFIGTRNGWAQRLQEKSVEVRDHCIAKLPEAKVPKK